VLTLLLLVAPLATAKVDQLSCALDGAPAMDSTIAAAVYMFAATQRCDKNAKGTYDDVKCEIDIASSIQAVSDMINIIIGAVNKCDTAINTQHAACGAAVGSLTSAAAGLAAGAGGITNWIQDKKTGGDYVVDVTTKELGKCVANVGGAAHGLFSAAAGIKAATKGCAGTDGEACATDVLNVISVLSNIGSAVAHITDQCTGTHNLNGAMTGDILKFVSAANAVATAGMAVDKACKVSEPELAQAQIVEVQVPRLYAAEMAQKMQSSTTMNIALVALLPIAAVVGFVGGRRMSKRNTRAVLPLGEELE